MLLSIIGKTIIMHQILWFSAQRGKVKLQLQLYHAYLIVFQFCCYAYVIATCDTARRPLSNINSTYPRRRTTLFTDVKIMGIMTKLVRIYITSSGNNRFSEVLTSMKNISCFITFTLLRGSCILSRYLRVQKWYEILFLHGRSLRKYLVSCFL